MDRVKITEAVSEPTPAPALRQSLRPPEVTPGTILTLAAACGLLVANIYYAQPLIAEIAQSLGLATGAAGLIVTMSQIGCGVGLLFVVPLGDLVENRRLVLISATLSAVALACAAFAPSAGIFLTCAAVIGLGSVAVQILIPLAAHLAPDATRGRVVGMVSSGLMIGIMLARPVSSFIAAQSSWRVVFGLSAMAMVILGVERLRALEILHDLLGLVDDPEDRLAGLAARRPTQLFEHLVEALDVAFRLVAMSLESLLKFGRRGFLGHFGQGAQNLLLGEVDILEGL